MKRFFLLIMMVAAFAVVMSACTNKASDGQNNTTTQKTLVVYYSRSGNTEGIAKQVAQSLGADIELIEVAEAYPTDYKALEKLAQEETENNVQRPIKPLQHQVKDYDRIIVGTPTWWYKMASPVLTFLSQTDFKDKTVVPFMTNAGWPGTVIKDMTAISGKNGAKVVNAKEFKFNTSNDGSQHGMATPESELTDWINSLKTADNK